jgi:hypothetical protein
MAELSSERRKNIPKSQKGLPGKHKEAGKQGQSGDYPMPDRAHAQNAKARATQQYNKGNLSKAEKDRIHAKANRKLGQSGKK